MILEGWSANVSFSGGVSTDWADHTWVYSPANNRVFECWGGHDGPNKRHIVSGDGSYNWANCCRCPIWPFPDTAGIGIYAIDGVCHQSANCFLYTANTTLNFNVRGYWFSLFSYGTFGRSYLRWLATPYGWCSWTTPRAAVGAPASEEAEGTARGPQEEDPTIRIVREVYGPMTTRGKAKHPNELLADEVAAVTKLHRPEIDPSQFRDIQMEYLRQKDELIARGHKEEQLAKRLDDLARKTQKEIAKRLGREHYERLMGVAPDAELGLVEPNLVGAAGVPTPPQEVIREQAAEDGEAGSSQEPGGKSKAT
jgi:hypothetical protein